MKEREKKRGARGRLGGGGGEGVPQKSRVNEEYIVSFSN